MLSKDDQKYDPKNYIFFLAADRPLKHSLKMSFY